MARARGAPPRISAILKPVPLSLEDRQIGRISVLTCGGHLVEGAESAQLEAHVARLLLDQSCLVLNLAGLTFLDSSGLGLLLRLLSRARLAGGGLKLCDVPARIAEVLRVTRLQASLVAYPTEAEAIAAFYERSGPGEEWDFRTDVLCVATSADVLAYLSAVLSQAGYGVTTSANISDALILLRATRPRAVVVGADIRALRGTAAADAFHGLAEGLRLIELEPGFSSEDAGDAGRRLLDRLAEVR